MYGGLLPHDEKGLVDNGLGKRTPFGSASLIAPTIDITETGQNITIDGVDMQFHYCTNTEAPVEIDIWFPDHKALFMAENCVATLHNILTLRGAQIRDPLSWAECLDEARRLYGDQAEVVFTAHNWPRYGNDKVIELLENQRDMYKYINDQTLNLINKGYTMDEIANMIVLPQSLQKYWYTHGFYGQIYMGAKATYQKYLGFYDANPINLKRLPPEEFARNITEYMGGADAVLKRLARDYDAGNYQLVATIANYLVFADPDNMQAREMEAAALEQLGYQAEAGTWRNFYLTGAQELRNGVQKLPTPNTASPDTVRAMTPEMFFDYLAVHINGEKAGAAKAVFNIDLGKDGGKYKLELENGVLNHTANAVADNADASIALSRDTLNKIILKQETLKQAEAQGKVKISGNGAKLDEMLSYMDTFAFWFNIVTP